MNLLVEQLPVSVRIGDRDYKFNTDFRFALRAIMAYEDNELTMAEKQAVLLFNIYVDIPRDVEAAVKEALNYLNAGEASGENSGVRVYSFMKDASLIYAAFRQSHGIDLTTAELHWHQFMALFMDLGSETAFTQLISLRRRVKTGKASKEERQIAIELGESFDVPDIDDRTLQEREEEDEFLRLVREGRRNRKADGNSRL